ncbi:MAG TPA: hypothetical protein VJR89_26065 [Polyangiales bacterium]|nr:hypothetical protein [Polyangiales bacterium]
MLTVVVMLSGPHRLGMLETALTSIPIESPAISRVHIMHAGGRWDWGGELRARFEAHPKVRIFEFPNKVDFAPSYNRQLDTVETTWALMLPDDDYLLRDEAARAFEALAQDKLDDRYGFVAFGWYYLRDGRFLGSHVKRRNLTGVLNYLPKLVTTVLNAKRVRELGGFAGNVGGFNDTVLFGRLAYEFDALLSRTRIGVYRLHSGQESARVRTVYGPYADTLRETIGPYARSASELEEFERRLEAYANPRPRPAADLLQEISFQLRSHTQPGDAPWQALVRAPARAVLRARERLLGATGLPEEGLHRWLAG